MDMESEINQLDAKAARLRELREEFPDLQTRKLRWSSVLISSEVTKNPEGVATSYSCGCCSDSAKYAKFYVKRGDDYIYADTPEILIGERDSYEDAGYRLDHDWRKTINKYMGKQGELMLEAYLGLETV